MISLLLTGLIVLLLISATLAPIESLGWWAGWFGEKESLTTTPPSRQVVVVDQQAAAMHYLVYLSGIGAITHDSIPLEEIKWLDALGGRVPGTILVLDVFPYSVTNVGLTSERAFARLWRWLEQLQLSEKGGVLPFLINLRNVLQVAVSADHRYGPIYNLGVAHEIGKALQAHGYRIGSGTPVTLLGWSGGGQIAIGAATFLKPMLHAPIRVIAIGGVMSDDQGLKNVTHLYQFYGDKDPVQGLGGKLFPGRWPIAKQSDWNRALAEQRITSMSLGPMTHNGKDNYFSWDVQAPDGRAYAEATLDAVTGALTREGLLNAAPGA
ncbi:MAG: hypothetical protein MI924_04090 [Chloroflexales bacterium]|nr:hypothetical protein [Chloroflexales bacterium]